MASSSKKEPVKLLATGGIRTREQRLDNPVLYQFPGSFNAGKATFAVQLSQKKSVTTIKPVVHFRDNYTIWYARLNPDTMAVPTMEIDDKVITDSFDMCKYLLENYPGAGDQEVVAAGKKDEMMEWIDFCKAWDEYMFTYSQVAQGNMLNDIRLTYLRYYLNELLTQSPTDKDFLVEKYVQKIAGISVMKRAQCEGAQKDADLKENIEQLHEIMARASEILGDSTGFLFGPKPSTGDVFFLPIFRIFHMVKKEMFDEMFAKYPNLKGYWERALKDADVKAGLMHYVSGGCMVGTMLRTLAPKTLLAYKMGLLKAPPIPEDIEKRIDDATKARWEACRP